MKFSRAFNFLAFPEFTKFAKLNLHTVTYLYRNTYSCCGGEMLHLIISSIFIYYLFILLDILITIYLINEIIWEIKERAKLNLDNTYESLACAKWRDPKIQD